MERPAIGRGESGVSPTRRRRTSRLRTQKRPGNEGLFEAAEGIRTLDLLHGKQNVRFRASQESPAKQRFPGCRWSAMLSSFYREIAGVSGLKPDWGSCGFGRRLRSRTWEHVPPHAPGSRGARVTLLLLDTQQPTPANRQPADACVSSDAGASGVRRDASLHVRLSRKARRARARPSRIKAI